jgi:hypothetical protein
MQQMESYPVDTDPEQVVRWLMVERQIGSPLLEINARRVLEAQDIPVQQELRLGDEEREDLSDAATIATLEIAPIHAGDGWRLTVVVEDESGSRDPDEVSADESIDLETFYSEFVRPGRGTTRLVAEVEGPEAEARLARLLGAVETNSHPHDRGPPPA